MMTAIEEQLGPIEIGQKFRFKETKKPTSDLAGEMRESLTIKSIQLDLYERSGLIVTDVTQYKVPYDYTIFNPKTNKTIRAQIKTSSCFNSNGINRKGNKAKTKKNSWVFDLPEHTALYYCKENIQFIVCAVVTERSYRDKLKSKELIYWVIPIDRLMEYWYKNTSGTKYAIAADDQNFHNEYCMNYNLLLEHSNG